MIRILVISYEIANDKIGRVSINDFIGQFSRVTKPRRQKFTNFFDSPTSALQLFRARCFFSHRLFAEMQIICLLIRLNFVHRSSV